VLRQVPGAAARRRADHRPAAGPPVAERRHPNGDRERVGSARCLRAREDVAVRAHEAGALHGDLGNRGPAWLRTPDDVNALVPELWPRTVTRAGAGALTVGGGSVTDLAAEYGTPADFLARHDLRARCRDFTAAFADADVFYAGKSFLCKAVVKVIDSE